MAVIAWSQGVPSGGRHGEAQLTGEPRRELGIAGTLVDGVGGRTDGPTH